jgi:membrane protease YdiL (CAAX protease family)
MREKLTRNDWLFIAVCLLVAGASLFVILNWFQAAFPEASLDLKVDRQSSLKVAEPLLRAQRVPTASLEHATTFESDDGSRIFLERTIGLKRENEEVRRGVHLWAWHHRWFKPLQEEEWQIDVAPTGEITGWLDKLPEDVVVPDVDLPAARGLAEGFLRTVRVNLADIQLVATSERRLPHRMQRIFTWESKSLRPGGAPYRTVVTVDGNRVTKFTQGLKIPDAWLRQYGELRSKNSLAGGIDTIFLAITMISALVVFIIRLRRGDTPIPLLLAVGGVTTVLMLGVSVNSFPATLANYDTASSYPAFIAWTLAGSLISAIGAGMFLIVLTGAGEPLYRERLPNQLALPRLWTPHALTSKRVFRSFVLGYSLVAFFLAYQVAFYLIAGKFGAWAPAEVPYDDMLSSRFPWIAVLFAGFFPALSEEMMSRAFSIPFFEKVLRSKVAAIVVAGFIWGFGHATYPNQPFYIRGVEVGLAGVLIGFLFHRFGILPLLIWHYTVDALYTALLLFRSGNQYYIVSAGLASLLFFVPMLVSAVLYIRNRGFVPDDDLTNATLPTAAPPPHVEEEPDVALPEPIPLRSPMVLACVAIAVIALALVAMAPRGLEQAIDYRITRGEAIALAMKWLGGTQHAQPLEKRAAAPTEAFRSWDAGAQNEEGGAPDGFDSVAAEYLARHGMTVRQIAEVMRHRVRAANWMVRTYTPLQKQEYLIEVDPRTSQVIGYHRYQEETKPGPQLDQAAALALAHGAFGTYGLDPKAFDVKEALDFQQPARRDWLFHFQERTPLAGEAFRRVSVRVAGQEVSQFATTIKIPDAEYRRESERTLVNVIVGLLKLAGALTLLALVIAGLIISTRRGHFPWRQALRWTAILSFIPLAGAAVRLWQSPFVYNTSTQWWTFLTGRLTESAAYLGRDLGILFLAIAGLAVIFPFAFELPRREARARFGRSAAVAALTAVALFVAQRGAMELISAQWPRLAMLRIDVPHLVAVPFPAFFAIGNALLRAIEVSAAIAMFWVAVSPFRRRLPWLPAVATIVPIFFLQLDSGVNRGQMPLMVADALLTAVMIWVVLRYVLRDNLLAYPLAAALTLLLQEAGAMLGSHRADLQANAVVTLAATIVLLLWFVIPSPARDLDLGDRV